MNEHYILKGESGESYTFRFGDTVSKNTLFVKGKVFRGDKNIGGGTTLKSNIEEGDNFVEENQSGYTYLYFEPIDNKEKEKVFNDFKNVNLIGQVVVSNQGEQT